MFIECLLSQSAPPYQYRPFFGPLPVWDYWPWLIIPLVVAVAIVYKCVKCRTVDRVPREAAVLTLWILGSMAAAAAALAVLVWVVEAAKS